MMKYSLYKTCPKCGNHGSVLDHPSMAFHSGGWLCCRLSGCPKMVRGREHFRRVCSFCGAVWFELPLDAEEKCR